MGSHNNRLAINASGIVSESIVVVVAVFMRMRASSRVRLNVKEKNEIAIEFELERKKRREGSRFERRLSRLQALKKSCLK